MIMNIMKRLTALLLGLIVLSSCDGEISGKTPPTSDFGETSADTSAENNNICATADCRHITDYHSFISELVDYAGGEKFDEWVSRLEDYDDENVYEFIK